MLSGYSCFMNILRHKTALTRYELSRPVSLAVGHGVIDKETRVFDYGCGLGFDVRFLSDQGYDIQGWDPHHHVRVKQQYRRPTMW